MESVNTIQMVSTQDCTGCGACHDKCPVSAITMAPDKNGFFYPKIQEKVCIGCGACHEICPVVNPIYKNNPEPECYAVWAPDEIREISSSGGVFSLLAEKVLSSDGVVFGAAYTEDCYGVQHVKVTKKEDLWRVRGSKYVQSDMQTVYREIEHMLQLEKPVLFSGCPCHNAALHNFLQKDYENLFCIDLVCHGTPSGKLLELFVKEQEQKVQSKAVTVSFRDKTVAPWDPATSIRFQNGTRYEQKRNSCPYLKAFLNLLDLREGCGQCRFARLPRQGDLTLADFWDVHRFKAEYDDRKGTSCVLVNNEKGERMLTAIKDSCKLCEPVPLSHAIRYNSQIRYSSIHSPERDRFFQLLNQYHYGFEKAADFALNRKYDIGYVGWWYGNNYGSALTSYALNRYLDTLGKTVLMLEFPALTPESVPQNRRRKGSLGRTLGKGIYEIAEVECLQKYGRFNEQCETFLVGSDQLWNWWSNRDVKTTYYFLDFANDDRRKIAYSTSFGHQDAYYPEELLFTVTDLHIP